MGERKNELIKLNENVLSQHFKNMENYNDFYNNYLEWVNDSAVAAERFRVEWLQNKTSWELSFENNVRF